MMVTIEHKHKGWATVENASAVDAHEFETGNNSGVFACFGISF